MEQFRGKVAIITGAASGIGRALAQELAGQGACVMLADINHEQAQQVAGNLAQAEAFYLDVTQAEQVQKLVDEVVARHGRLDYIFNNAGIGISGEVRDTPLEQWNRILDINLRGVIHGVAAAYPVMLKQGYGHIVNTASGLGLIPGPTTAAYSTTKAAVVTLSNMLRLEAETLGVKVSVVCPGFIATDIYNTTTYLKVKRQDIQSGIPIKMMDPTRCAQEILKGVSKNQAIITVPSYVRVLWWLNRYVPALVKWINRKTLKSFRKARSEETV